MHLPMGERSSCDLARKPIPARQVGHVEPCAGRRSNANVRRSAASDDREDAAMTKASVKEGGPRRIAAAVR